MLYLAVGDGGGTGDPDNDAQNTESLLGKILRIDVNGDAFPDDASRNYAIPGDNPFVGQAGADEVYAYGLRNPFRASFDTATGDLYIGDVGQSAREEVNRIPADSRGLNFGWHVREGDLPYDTDTPGNPAPDDPSLVEPIAVYDRSRPNGGASITGGYVYHGPGGLQGHYIFADFVFNNLYTLKVENGAVVDYSVRTGQVVTDAGTPNQIASFAVDGTGRLYAVGLDGEIHRLTPSAAAADGGDRLEGGEGVDRLFGGAGDDTLDGGAGDDRLDGGIGFNRLLGGEGTDLAVYTAVSGVYIDLALGTYSGPGRYEVLESIEGVVGTVHNDTAFGTEGPNVLLGGDGADILIGRGGADRLDGGAGDDWLDGEAGNDRLAGGTGINVLRGGAGFDVADYSGAAGVWVDLAAGVYSAPDAFDSFVDIEGLLGSAAPTHSTATEPTTASRGSAGTTSWTAAAGPTSSPVGKATTTWWAARETIG
jgi:Ca2+-binding RTX toxin-like protein